MNQLPGLISAFNSNGRVSLMPDSTSCWKSGQSRVDATLDETLIWDRDSAPWKRSGAAGYSPSLKKNAGSMCSGLISLTSPISIKKCGPRMQRQLTFGSLHAAGIRIGLRGLSFVTTV
jgi:hypothetical protein